MKFAQSSFKHYVHMVTRLNAKYFSVLRAQALKTRRAIRDEGAEERWYGEGGNIETPASRRHG